MPFVSASIYKKASRLMFEEGISPDLLDVHKKRMTSLVGAKYIPMELLLEVYEIADKHLKPGFGVRQGMQLRSDDYGTLGLSWRTCWRAKDVFERVVRYMVLVTDHGMARIKEKQGITKIILHRDASRIGIEIANEATFVMLTGILKEVTDKQIRPLKVSFKHTNKATKLFTDYFNCPVLFGQGEYAIWFKTADVDIPTLKADKSIHQFLVKRMDEEKKGIHANADKLIGEIHKLIEEALPSGIPSIIQVADYVGMSPRTLNRRLAGKGYTFRELVQQIQQETATGLIRNTDQTIGEIAFQTGFSEQSAFNRAFKRWTGQSPVDYRKHI